MFEQFKAKKQLENNTEKYINYKVYNNYIKYKYYKMGNTTTIAITNEVKNEIAELGLKGETYSDILKRLIASARKRMLHDLLFDEKGTVPIEDAIARAKERWQK